VKCDSYARLERNENGASLQRVPSGEDRRLVD
jgi:hypothetical protein